MKRNTYILLLSLIFGLPVLAQNDSVHQLEEVLLSDVRLHENSEGQQVTVLNDSTLKRNGGTLGSALKFNTPIYFKENGYGMVSSASFRGTSASQTAVVWNGININSQFTGQTDFNTILTTNYDNIGVRHGGGSVLYGSGAMGGTVHLNNRFSFTNSFNNELKVEYGSFNTLSGYARTEFSTEKLSVEVSVSGITSDNDYPYLGTDLHNENGDFHNMGINAGVAYLLDTNNTLKFYSNFSEGEKAFSGTLTAPSKSKHRDINSRNLIEWKGFYNRFTSSLKLAYLDEHYQYFENRYTNEYDFGRAKTGIAKYDLKYKLNGDVTLNGILDFKHTNGKGSNVGQHQRNIGAFAFLLSHELDDFGYEISARKEITDSYDSPLLYSLSANYEVSDFYRLRMNASRNFRIPTFNDLFWRAGGNMELQPEESHQIELGQDMVVRDFEFGLTAYLIEITNLLRWIPESGGLWRPENTKNVVNKGIEFTAGWEKVYGDHFLQFNGTYAYTHTKDETLDKELIYVPKHKATASLGYSVNRFFFYYQFLYNGSIFTSADNNYELEGYPLSNLGLGYSFGEKQMLEVGVEVDNLWNQNYQSLPSRPMPGRSISTSLIFNF